MIMATDVRDVKSAGIRDDPAKWQTHFEFLKQLRLEDELELHGYNTFDQDTVVHVHVHEDTDNVVPIQITHVHVVHAIPYAEWL